MKKYISITYLIVLLTSLSAQTSTIFDLEEFTLPGEKVLQGKNFVKSYTSTKSGLNLILPTLYDTQYAYWAKGWAISGIQDSTLETASSSKHLFANRAYSGYNNSSLYAVGQNKTYLKLTGLAKFKSIQITNSLYTYNSMKLGDNFAKKFGGLTGTDEDSLVLTISCFKKQVFLKTVSVALADFRGTKTKLLSTWENVNLDGDSIAFTLSTSDMGQFGANTPFFFIADNIEVVSTANTNTITENDMVIYPNPATGFFSVNSSFAIQKISLINAFGKTCYTKVNPANNENINTANLAAGVYFTHITSQNYTIIKKLIIN